MQIEVSMDIEMPSIQRLVDTSADEIRIRYQALYASHGFKKQDERSGIKSVKKVPGEIRQALRIV